MEPLQIIFAGSGEFGLPTLRALADAAHRIVKVVTQPDRPAGRGRKLTATPIGHWAAEHGLPLLKTDNINREALAPADAMVVVAFGQKLGETVVNLPRLGSINLHASRLPACRGAAPINWAVMRGETMTGNSVIRLAQKMDAGAILAQSQVPIGDVETAGELHDRLAADGAPLILRVLQQLATGMAVEQPQDESLATLAPKLGREATRLDWTRPAVELARQIRGLSPWPGCRTRLLDAEGKELGHLILLRACAAEGEGPRWRSGELMCNGLIATADAGGVEILQCQPEGRGPMTLAEYRHGHAWQPGTRLESIL